MMYEYENLKYEIHDKGVTIAGVLDNCFSSLQIPETINNKPVRKIGFRAFAGRSNNDSCKLMSSIELPYGLMEIAGGAFAACISLEKISLSSTVVQIDGSAFYNCKSLSEVEISDSVVSISETAFENCMNLKGITIVHYEKTPRKSGFFPNLFSGGDSHAARPAETGKTFVYIPKDESGLYGDYVRICGKYFSWEKYDSLFSLPLPLSGKIKIALFRLQNPYDLSDKARNEYETYLRSYRDMCIENYIKADNLEMIVKFGSIDMINREMINEYIITAKITGSNNVLLYLVSYRYKKITNPKHE